MRYLLLASLLAACASSSLSGLGVDFQLSAELTCVRGETGPRVLAQITITQDSSNSSSLSNQRLVRFELPDGFSVTPVGTVASGSYSDGRPSDLWILPADGTIIFDIVVDNCTGDALEMKLLAGKDIGADGVFTVGSSEIIIAGAPIPITVTEPAPPEASAMRLLPEGLAFLSAVAGTYTIVVAGSAPVTRPSGLPGPVRAVWLSDTRIALFGPTSDAVVDISADLR